MHLVSSRRGLQLFLAALSILVVHVCFFESARNRITESGFDFVVPEKESLFDEHIPGSELKNGSLEYRSNKNKLPPCKILVANHRVSYHVEVLESILALFPSSSLPLPSTCNRDILVFNFALSKRPGCDSWRKYFLQEMLHKTYNGTWVDGTHSGEKRIPGQCRFARSKDMDYVNTIREKHHATIEASCYCNDEFEEIMKSRNDTACIFHERCDQMTNNERAFWLSPHHPRYLFPSVLPLPSSPRTPSPNLPIRLCTVGSTSRRNFLLLHQFLQSLDSMDVRKLFRINLLGKGKFPPVLRDYKDVTTHLRITDFVKFQHTVAEECDIMMPLVNKESKYKRYFNDERSAMKLSGSIVQAVSYDIPMVIHEELAELYRTERGASKWATHTDDPTSFTLALQRLVESVGNVTLTVDTTLPPDHDIADDWGPSALDSLWND